MDSAPQSTVLLRILELKPCHINTSEPMWGELHVSRPGVYYAGEVFGAVGGNGSGMIESPVPGLAGSSSVMPQSPPIMEQQLGNRGSIYSD